eukprot:scaffold39502_cov19-Prasinocladus_malaysianus.AAC.2
MSDNAWFAIYLRQQFKYISGMAASDAALTCVPSPTPTPIHPHRYGPVIETPTAANGGLCDKSIRCHHLSGCSIVYGLKQ